MTTALSKIYPLAAGKPPATVTKENVKIGDPVECDHWYKRGSTWERVGHAATGEPRQPRPNIGHRCGFVVGIRSVIMRDIVYVPVSPDTRHFRERATGTYESVLLVSESIYREPFIVRFEDARFVEEGR